MKIHAFSLSVAHSLASKWSEWKAISWHATTQQSLRTGDAGCISFFILVVALVRIVKQKFVDVNIGYLAYLQVVFSFEPHTHWWACWQVDVASATVSSSWKMLSWSFVLRLCQCFFSLVKKCALVC